MSNIDKFKETMKTLLSPNGCPWDREQTLESLKPFLIEEAYEVIEAIEENNVYGHKEELGDLLLQIVFQSQIRENKGDFTFEDVVDTINKKMISRHPHVFSNNTDIKTASDVLDNWDDFKKAEGKKVSFFKDLQKGFPALSESLLINKKAAKTGFDWKNIDDIYTKLDEEVLEFKEAKTQEEKIDELGDILFVIVNLARRHKIDPEEALRKSNRKFKKRFLGILEMAKKKNLDFESLSLDEMDELWDEFKRNNK
jgi:tetrapyrrole methylase family protein/MazG family protein